MNHREMPKFVDLFAGCGGLSLGLEEAGMFPIFVNEVSPQPMATYLVNRRHINPLLEQKFHLADAKDLVLKRGKIRELIDGFKLEYGIDCKKGELDLIAGGPPCQGFSGIGHRRSYSVDKEQLPSNHLFQDMAFVVAKLRPKAFLFENVAGLLSAKWTSEGEKGEIWQDVLGTFRNIPGYDVKFSLVHAKDYGVPQNRPRVLIVGLREELAFGSKSVLDAVAGGYLPKPTGGYPSVEETIGDLVDPHYQNGGETLEYPTDPKNELQRRFRSDPTSGRVANRGHPIFDHSYSRHAPNIVAKFKHMIANDGEIPLAMQTKKFAQKVLPATWGPNGPSITITSMPDDYVHFCQPRSLSVREWARLQTFPDWYVFEGKRTTGGLRRAGNPREGIHDREVPKYTQIGNAVPVLLAKAIGTHLLGILRGELPTLKDSKPVSAKVSASGVRESNHAGRKRHAHHARTA